MYGGFSPSGGFFEFNPERNQALNRDFFNIALSAI